MGDNGLFNRQYQVSITSPYDISTVAAYGNIGTSALSSFPGQVQASALRVAFDLVKNATESPNKGTIQITNMSAATRSALRPGLQVELTAGYQDQTQTLFQGGLFFVNTKNQGAETLTTLEIIDGDAACFALTFDKSYPAGTPVPLIFTDIINVMALPTPAAPLGISRGAVSGIPTVAIPAKYSASGPLRQTLAELCRNYGLEWSIQNSTLEICPLDSHIGATGDLISRDTGMLGIPSFDGKVLLVTCLLNPRLQPGRLIEVASRDISGTFKIRAGHWTGDSHGDTWQVELECIPMGGTAAALSGLGSSVKNVIKDFKTAQSVAKKAAKKGK